MQQRIAAPHRTRTRPDSLFSFIELKANKPPKEQRLTYDVVTVDLANAGNTGARYYGTGQHRRYQIDFRTSQNTETKTDEFRENGDFTSLDRTPQKRLQFPSL
jgi:hypothetical protein